jgi:hypothetical protein
MSLRTRIRRLSALASGKAEPVVRIGFLGSPIRWEGKTITRGEYEARVAAGARPRIIFDWPQQKPQHPKA